MEFLFEAYYVDAYPVLRHSVVECIQQMALGMEPCILYCIHDVGESFFVARVGQPFHVFKDESLGLRFFQQEKRIVP